MRSTRQPDLVSPAVFLFHTAADCDHCQENLRNGCNRKTDCRQEHRQYWFAAYSRPTVDQRLKTTCLAPACHLETQSVMIKAYGIFVVVNNAKGVSADTAFGRHPREPGSRSAQAGIPWRNAILKDVAHAKPAFRILNTCRGFILIAGSSSFAVFRGTCFLPLRRHKNP